MNVHQVVWLAIEVGSIAISVFCFTNLSLNLFQREVEFSTLF